MMAEEGLRFRPTEAELLKMLRQFTAGEYTGNLVEIQDLYGEKEPWEICTATGTATNDNTWYFFTKLKRKSTKNVAGKRFLRSVGKGTWHGTSKVEKIFHDERRQILLGFKRDFTYWGDEERRGEFVMNEFSLPENTTVKPDRKDFVICRLKRKKKGPINDGVEDTTTPSNNNDDVSFSYDELLGGIEVEDMTAPPALLQIEAACNYGYYNNETHPPCTTNAAAAVAAAPLSGVLGGSWTLQMMEDFLLQDDDYDGGDAAVAIQEGKTYPWISSTLENFEDRTRRQPLVLI